MVESVAQKSNCICYLNYLYIRIIFSDMFFNKFMNNLDQKVDDLHGADEREACEEPHGASYGGELVHKLGCSILI